MSAAASPNQGGETPGLLVGTRVWKNRTGNGAKFGTVMPHAPEYSRGSFPVRFDDGIWEVLDVSYVTVVVPKGNARPPTSEPNAVTA